MWRRGLAYRKKQFVNWCPSCKTVLADEQVIAGKCERCSTVVVRKDMEQWFFRITKYAGNLLDNLNKIDWSEKVKIAQRNWIGRSEGALLNFEMKDGIASSYVLLHGYTSSPKANFFPWLKKELEKRGAKVYVPALPDSDDPKVYDQVAEVLKSTPFDENTVLLGHSLGGVVAMKVLEKLKKPVRKTIFVASFTQNRFLDEEFQPHTFDWKFDAEKIRKNAGSIHLLRDTTDDTVPQYQADNLRNLVGGTIFDFVASKPHACGEEEPEILRHCVDSLQVFTTRPDTLFGATYMVVAPEHGIIEELKDRITNYKEVEVYIKKASNKSEEERIEEGKEKTGVELKGIKALNPVNNEEIPVFAADYVLSNYGTGAIMAVPAHDDRDFEFAKRYKLPIKEVVSSRINADRELINADKKRIELYAGEGVLVNSGEFNGMDSEKAGREITKLVGGELKTQYRLRDWLISRQRYWGAPIPMIHCETCVSKGEGEQKEMPGWYAVPEKDLPVKLPYVKDFRPQGKGESPLASVKEFYEVRCPHCGGKARRETDVSDTFLDSAWYYLRYPSVTEKNKAWNSGITKKWFPVNLYTGGAEHSVLHLLYVRFVAMVFHDAGSLHFEEPFPKFRAHGLLIKEGAKMSKSKGNVINPDEYIKKFGADSLRMYLMFLAPFEQGGDFRDEAVMGIVRFLDRVWKLFSDKIQNTRDKETSPELERLMHRTIKKITDDIESLHYNTAISALMIFLNEFENRNPGRENKEIFLKLLAPFAPHMTEELWRELGNQTSIHKASWPVADPKFLKEEDFDLVVQVNGKLRATIKLKRGASQKEAEIAAFLNENVTNSLGGQEPKKIIFVPNRLINFVV